MSPMRGLCEVVCRMCIEVEVPKHGPRLFFQNELWETLLASRSTFQNRVCIILTSIQSDHMFRTSIKSNFTKINPSATSPICFAHEDVFFWTDVWADLSPPLSPCPSPIDHYPTQRFTILRFYVSINCLSNNRVQ